jgi:hypothetical protein
VTDPLTLQADPARTAAILAIDDLLSRLKLDHAFVGEAAMAAWLSHAFHHGPVDVLAVMTPEQKGQVPMMAMNRGFEVDRASVESTDELDLIPLAMRTDGELVRIHVLVASNALYAWMVKGALQTSLGERQFKVARAEDLVLMLLVSDAPVAAQKITEVINAAGARFDRGQLNEKLVSIGLSQKVLS